MVEQAGGELGGAVDLEPRARVGEEGEAEGVRLGEAVGGKGQGGLADFFDDGFVAAGAAEGDDEFGEGALKTALVFHITHGTTKFLGLAAGEVGEFHGEFEHLFLKKNNAEGAAQDGGDEVIDAGIDVGDGFESGAAADERVGKMADDGAGADDGDLDGDIVKAGGAHPWERRHLGAAFDLENSDGVGVLHRGESGGVVGRDGVKFDGAAAIATECKGGLEGGHHTEAEEVDLDDTEVLAIGFIPLDDNAAGHGGVFEWDDAVELALANDHAAAVLTEMAGKTVDLVVEADHGLGARMVGGDAGGRELLLQWERIGEIAVGAQSRETIQGVVGETEDLADFADGTTPAVSDDIGGHGGAAGGVGLVDALDDALAEFAAGEIEIDIRP